MVKSEFAQLKERFDYLSERQTADHSAVNCPADKLVELCIALRDDFGYDLLVDLTAVDWDAQSPRFTGMYHLLSTTKHKYCALLRIARTTSSQVCHRSVRSSRRPIGMMRETYDLMGIHYDGHPDLRRILMWDEYPYHPLRKDFPRRN